MDWEERLAAHWARLDDLDQADFLEGIEQLAAELPPGEGIAMFERAAALDSTGHSDLAVPRYRKALELGLSGERRRRAVIQLASSLRNIGGAEESVALLRAEQAEASDALDDAVAAMLALALTSLGREREAVAVAVMALTRHMPRYQRSMTNYAAALLDSQDD
jgi:Flp pilus assembly protein TadD